jgi:hypothetical protein
MEAENWSELRMTSPSTMHSRTFETRGHYYTGSERPIPITEDYNEPRISGVISNVFNISNGHY